VCGINAVFDGAGAIPNKRALISSMNARMVYRGPDGEGLYDDAQVAMGMRRLSIIDVAGGSQPIFNEDHSLVLVCNGEIYNHVELMRDLTARGHQFSTGSDVETILHMYEEKGEACLADLRGMFAFVLWDMKRKRLFAGRDRLGIKPLYFSQKDGALWLSSELRTIVAAAGIAPTLRATAVYEFLAYSYPLNQRHTPVNEVDRMLPGEYLVADGGGVQFKRYWTPAFGGDAGLEDRVDAELLETLNEAVGIHLRSDVPVGILLSAGLDSSTIAAIASRAGSNYTAISAGYSGQHAVDERSEARKLAALIGMDFLEIESDTTQFDTYFEELVQYCDEPVGDIAAMAQWSLYQQSRAQGFKVLLSGVGGDEVMFGYPAWNQLGQHLRTLGGDPEARAEHIAGRLSAHLGQETDQLASGALRAAKSDVVPALAGQCAGASQGPDEMAALLFGTYLVHNGCQLADKLGMGCSVEVRVPLLDHIFVEQVFALPLARRFELGQSKPLLRRLMRGVLPDAVRERTKTGFAPPTAFIDDLVRSRIESVLDGRLASQGWLNGPQLLAMASRSQHLPWIKRSGLRHRLGIGFNAWFLFRLIAFERWYDHLVSGDTPDHAGARSTPAAEER